MSKIKQKAIRRKNAIYFRYIFPIIAMVISFVSIFIPCLKYSTASEGANPKISLYDLMDNSWYQVRTYLFANAEQTDAVVAFSEAVLITLIVFVLLAIVALITSVWTAVGAFRYFFDPKDNSNRRILFVTLFPNRVVVCILESLFLPILFFPRLLVLYYENLLNSQVLLKVIFVEPMWIGIVSYIAIIIMTAVFTSKEREMGMDPFKLRVKKESAFNDDEGDVKEEYSPMFSTKEENTYYELTQKSKEEQAERIRQLFRSNDDGGVDK